MKKVLAFFLCIVLLLSFLPTTVLAYTRTVKVGFFQFDGFNEIDYDGELSGYGYDYLMEISKYSGWRYEFVYEKSTPSGSEMLTYQDCLDMVKSGELDIVGTVRKNAEREEEFFFPNISSGTNIGILTVADGNKGIEEGKPSTLVNIKVGLLEGSSRNKEIEEYSTQHELGMQFVYFGTTDEMMASLLDDKTVDALYTSNLRKLAHERVVLILNSSPYYFVTSKKNTELAEELQNAIQQMSLRQPNFTSKLTEKYYSQNVTTEFTLTEEEKEYVRLHPQVNVACDENYLPYEYYDEKSGEMKGVFADVYKKLQDMTGLTFNFYHNYRYSDTYAFASDKDYVLSSYYGGYLNTEKNKFRMTADVVDISITAVVNGEINLASTGHKVAVVKNYYLTKYLMKSNPGNEYIFFDSMEECVKSVNSGATQLTYLPTYTADYFANNTFLHNIKFITNTEVKYSLGLGFPSDCNDVLFNMVNRAILYLPTNFVEDSIYLNMLALVNEDSFGSFFYKYPLAVLAIIMSVLLIVVLVAIVFYIRYNEKKLFLANAQIGEALTKADEANKAKTIFMSRMSHEIRTPVNAIVNLSQLATNHPCEQKQYLQKIQFASNTLLDFVNDVLDMSALENSKLMLNNKPLDINELVTSISSIYFEQCKNKGVEFNIQLDAPYKYLIGDRMKINQVLLNLISNAYKFTPKGGKILLKVSQTEQEKQTVNTQFCVQDTGEGIKPEMLPRLFEPFEQESANTSAIHGGSGLGLSITKGLVDLMKGSIDVTSVKNKGTQFTVTIPMQINRHPIKGKTASLGTMRNFDNAKVLLVEDNDINAEIAVALLEQIGLLCDRAKDGAQAVQMFASSTPFTTKPCLWTSICLIWTGLHRQAQLGRLNEPTP